MWVKRTADEIVDANRKRRRCRVVLAVVIGVLTAVLFDVKFSKRESVYQGRFFVPVNQMKERLPPAIAFGAILALLIYVVPWRNRPTVVCPQCGTTQYAGESPHCPSCGGRLEDIETMKWQQ